VKIALIMHELLVEGGGERQCVSLARALLRMGHDVDLYTSAYDRDHCFPEVCRELKVTEVGRGIFPWLRKPRVVRSYLDMWRLAEAVEQRYDVWNPHHWPAEWGAVRLKKKLGGVVVWTCNDVPNFHHKAHGNKLGIETLKRFFYWVDYLYDRVQARRIDLTVFLSQWAECEFKTIYPVSTAVVRSGADPDRFRPGGDRRKVRNRFCCDEDEFILLWLGIFMPHRRLEDAIEAVALLKKRGHRIKLLLAGSGALFPDYFAGLQALTAQRGVQEVVVFTGKVPDDEMRDFYCACDAFLFPNENQTWGLAVLEAMACGTPVLVSQGAAVHEALTDDHDAVLFPARDPAALAKKIEQLISDPNQREKIAANGLDLVRTEYNWQRFGEKMADVFHQVVSAAKSQGLGLISVEVQSGKSSPAK
jgi:glycosyltransferase involved in cell wall biosynthesis